jgi:hypothetical protein
MNTIIKIVAKFVAVVALACGPGGGGMAGNESASIRASAVRPWGDERPWRDGGTYPTCEKASERAAQLQRQGFEARVRQNIFTLLWYVIYR